MSTARESLLEAARAAVLAQSWTHVRMVDVAAAAGVSRQTLYNEFGSKEGLGAALVDHAVQGFLDGAVRAAADARRDGGDPAACCAASAAWMLRAAREEPVVHAALTGSWGAMPLPQSAAPGGTDRSGCEPAALASVLRDRMVARLAAGTAEGGPGAGPRGGPAARTTAAPSRGGTAGGPPAGAVRVLRIPPQQGLGRACEVGLRMALSYVVAPVEAPDDETCRGIGEVVRTLLPHR